MADGRSTTDESAGAGGVVWFAWAWVVLLLLAVVAELSGWVDLRLALDLQRHLH